MVGYAGPFVKIVGIISREEILFAADDDLAFIASRARIEARRVTPVDQHRLIETVRSERTALGQYRLVAGGETVRGIFVNYAILVHDGLGIHAGHPRPFLTWGWEAALAQYTAYQDDLLRTEALTRSQRGGIYFTDTGFAHRGVYFPERNITHPVTGQQISSNLFAEQSFVGGYGGRFRDPTTGRFVSGTQFLKFYD